MARDDSIEHDQRGFLHVGLGAFRATEIDQNRLSESLYQLERLVEDDEEAVERVRDIIKAHQDLLGRHNIFHEALYRGLEDRGTELDDPSELLEVHAAVRREVEYFQADYRRHIRIGYQERTPTYALVSRRRLGRVMLNLIWNAADAMQDREGKVTVAVDEEGTPDCEPIVGRFREHDRWSHITVQDEGSGLPLDEPIFSRSYTTKQGRSRGQGLDIVKRMVEQDAGAICLESKIDVGTNFHVYYPAISP